MKVDFGILLHDSCKNSKISSWGLGSWNPATKAHTMAYDMQLKDFTTMYDEEAIL